MKKVKDVPAPSEEEVRADLSYLPKGFEKKKYSLTKEESDAMRQIQTTSKFITNVNNMMTADVVARAFVRMGVGISAQTQTLYDLNREQLIVYEPKEDKK